MQTWKTFLIKPSRQILFSAFFGALVFFGANTAWRAVQVAGPALIIDAKDRRVTIHENTLRISISQERDRPACFGGKAIRRLFHYPEGVRPGWDNFDAVVAIPDDDLFAGTTKGRRAFDLWLPMPIPLPHYDRGYWYLGVKIFNGCNILSRLWPDEPVAAPLTAATVE